MWRHAKFGSHTRHVATLAVHCVNDGDVGIHQLRQVLVTAADNHLHTQPGTRGSQCANHVIGLHPGHIEHFPAHQTNHFMDRFDLASQIIGHGRTIGFVLGVNCIPKIRALGIKHTRGVLCRDLLAQTLQHIDHPANGTCGHAAGVAGYRPKIRHGMECPVQVAGAVHQQQR